MDDQLEKFWLTVAVVAFVVGAAVVAARGADIPPSCRRDFTSQRCADDLWRQRSLERALDDQRFWIDNDARIRQDDAEYDAWFRRNYYDNDNGKPSR